MKYGYIVLRPMGYDDIDTGLVFDSRKDAQKTLQDITLAMPYESIEGAYVYDTDDEKDRM